MEPIIRFQNYSFRYSSQAEPTLKDISLSIYPGEKVLICGPSGCGKSTLSHCLNGLIPHSYPGDISGELTIGGVPQSGHTIFSLSKTVGTVLQDSDGQFIGLTVGEDIAFALENDRVAHGEMTRRVDQAAQEVSVFGHLDHAPHELSGGQKQRVSLAGVMVDDVSVLLFDEPLANLDPATGKQAIELIDQIQKKRNATVVIIEHRLEDVLHCPVDRIVLMNDGRIVADASPAELLSSALLKENGIREPLYLTALRYAGVDVAPEKAPQSIGGMALSEGDKAKVRAWFQSEPPAPPAPEREPLLTVSGLDFSYSNGFHALKDISLQVYRGEMLGIVGRNGAGKSTFSKLICGFEAPQKGSVRFEGQDLLEKSIKQRAERIGYVMQNPNQMICRTQIADEVGLGLQMRGVPPEEIRPRVEETLKVCGLYEMRNWPVSALSYGQKKRVTIADIMVMKPALMILDEPTAGQDFRHYTEIMEFLLTLNQSGVTVMMITHDMHLMLEYCDRCCVFSDGQLIADKPPAQVLTDPELVRAASLKETSLYDLALRCQIGAPGAFAQSFITHDRRGRRA